MCILRTPKHHILFVPLFLDLILRHSFSNFEFYAIDKKNSSSMRIQSESNWYFFLFLVDNFFFNVKRMSSTFLLLFIFLHQNIMSFILRKSVVFLNWTIQSLRRWGISFVYFHCFFLWIIWIVFGAFWSWTLLLCRLFCNCSFGTIHCTPILSSERKYRTAGNKTVVGNVAGLVLRSPAYTMQPANVPRVARELSRTSTADTT